MATYTKLFSSILLSTIWRAPDHVRLLWITLLALSDQDGRVEASVPGLADSAKIDRLHCEQALAVLSAPDPDSRTTAEDGRRIAKIDGGWVIINYEKYRDKNSAEEVRTLKSARQARWREREAKRRRDETPVDASRRGRRLETYSGSGSGSGSTQLNSTPDPDPEETPEPGQTLPTPRNQGEGSSGPSAYNTVERTPPEPETQVALFGTPEGTPPRSRAAALSAPLVSQVIGHYRTHHPQANPGEKERKLIRDRLKEGYSVADICRAIDGNHNSPFHNGVNERAREYHALALIVRDSSHVVDFIELSEGTGKITTEREVRQDAAIEEFLSWHRNEYGDGPNGEDTT